MALSACTALAEVAAAETCSDLLSRRGDLLLCRGDLLPPAAAIAGETALANVDNVLEPALDSAEPPLGVALALEWPLDVQPGLPAATAAATLGGGGSGSFTV
eukprot:CAMPEP_0179033416 /NCGR_PEP_ID=MMETSP0796-20121207/12093_1 /TAXON_ID=73915 /ORGANISM="Pyrodinium bahamense, Strain pbaha01" /LENGTH=101 /DNA_ID=CAMNT_0020729675 /DNA_START=243 /DNA_END=544 /DNA_ORIENTATION=+